MGKSSLVKKLRLKSGQRVAIINAPSDYLRKVGELPEGVSISDSIKGGGFDIVHGFFTRLEDLEAEVEDLKSALSEDGILWISYPKLSAKMDSDLTRDVIWAALRDKGLKAVAQIAVDDIWSAMRFKR